MEYEYKRESTVSGHLPIEAMNALGAQGWDNYSIQGNVYYFKRAVVKIYQTIDELNRSLGYEGEKNLAVAPIGPAAKQPETKTPANNKPQNKHKR
jgi:hypothetical protein